jgi:hypothetical protein
MKDESKRSVVTELERVLEQSRIENAEMHITEDDGTSFKELISKRSEHADLVILGMPNLKQSETHGALLKRVDDLTQKLRVSLIVSANDKIDFRVN